MELVLKTVGIIAEYNPFHNGHQYHIEQSKKKCGADAVIVLMSGHFTQRGLPAIADKWTRAQWAIEGGADLVLELPFVYATRSAEYFARGGISIFDRLNIIDYISFGSETGSIEPLYKIAQIFADELPTFKTQLANELEKGVSFPTARQAALSSYLKQDIDISGANDILAVEYLKWLIKLKSNIKPITIKRTGTQYHESGTSGEFASANYIRELLYEHQKSPISISTLLPKTTVVTGELPSMDTFENLILCALRQTSTSQMSEICDVAEGLENKIKKASSEPCLERVMSEIKSKRYTHTRIARILLYCLFDFPKGVADTDYVRVLAVNQTGRQLLKKMKGTSDITIITSLNQKNSSLPGMSYDILAGDIFDLLFSNPKQRSGGKEFTTPVSIF